MKGWEDKENVGQEKKCQNSGSMPVEDRSAADKEEEMKQNVQKQWQEPMTNLQVDNDDAGLRDSRLQEEDVLVRGRRLLAEKVPHEEGHTGVPDPLRQPDGHRAARHPAVARVLRVEGGPVEERALGQVLLQRAVHEDGEGGVERVVEEEEETVEEGLGAVVGEEHVEDLA